MGNIPEIVLKQLSNQDEGGNILMVGPGSKTTEFSIRLRSDCKSVLSKQIGEDDCNACLYRVICKKERNIENGNLCYKKQMFDKIFLRADSTISEDLLLGQAKVLLKNQGNLMFFISSKPGGKKKALSNFCFDSNGILNKINSTQLSIESIKRIRFYKSLCAICVVVSENKK